MNELILKMIAYYGGDPKRIQHFMKVYAFACAIARGECLDETKRRIIEIAAIVHDIGIKNAEAKYGSCSGRLREKEGPPEAKKLLTDMGCYGKVEIERVCYLVAHHRTYTSIDGIDYRVLVEADHLADLYEEGASEDEIRQAYNTIFKTRTGKMICAQMYGIK